MRVRDLIVLSLLVPAAAQARSSYVANFPNGRAVDGSGCINCHNSAGGGDARNPFGRALGSSTNWARVCPTDSDGDGQTNGEELGDPDCIWSRGAVAARTTDISNPGKSSSMSADPTGGSTGGEGEGEGEGEGDDDSDDGSGESGGCASTGASNAGALAGLAMLLRRRRRA